MFRNFTIPVRCCSAIGPLAYWLSSVSAVVMPLRITVSFSPRAVMSYVFHFSAVVTVWDGPTTLTIAPDRKSSFSCVSAMLTS